jgi:two-component system sensor histidine kinase PrrB
VEPGNRGYLMRMLSLRTIVVVGALSVIALVVTLGAWVWFGVTNDQHSQLDRRLDSVSSLGDISTLLSNPHSDQSTPGGDLVRTARIGPVTVSVPSYIVLPKLDNGFANTTSTVSSTGSAPSPPAGLRLRSAPRWPKPSVGSTNCTCGCC